MLERYKANGKLILSAEYFVLNGATALVLPVRMGQSLEIRDLESKEDNMIEWIAFQGNQKWFNARIKIPELTILKTSDHKISNRLIIILQALVNLKPTLFAENKSLLFKTNLEFNRDWGLGSSSTLIANMAAWAKTDSMLLFNLISKGSGYDIVAADRKKPFLFNCTNNVTNAVPVVPSSEITPYLYFVYTGRKQDSESAIAEYLKLQPPVNKQIERISELSKGLSATDDLVHFQEMIREHEAILANHLNRPPVKDLLFSDYSGAVKSLGAWGGDFLLFVHTGIRNELENYLHDKGYNTYFLYDEMICN